MKKVLLLAAACFAAVIVLPGCAGTGKAMTDSASTKNLNMDGYVMYGVVETNNAETATPQGKLIVGRLTYKSRKVGIPADQKVPTTGYFKYTAEKNLFGTESEIMEYDFTAGSDADARAARDALDKKMEQARKLKSASGVAGSTDSGTVK